MLSSFPRLWISCQPKEKFHLFSLHSFNTGSLVKEKNDLAQPHQAVQSPVAWLLPHCHASQERRGPPVVGSQMTSQWEPVDLTWKVAAKISPSQQERDVTSWGFRPRWGLLKRGLLLLLPSPPPSGASGGFKDCVSQRRPRIWPVIPAMADSHPKRP